MKRIVIRTLGGNGIGYGHYYRCLSLAKAIILLDKEITITFLLNQDLVNLIENTGFDFITSKNLSEDYEIIKKLDINLFIFDSYLGDNEYLRKIKEKTKLMVIDDNNDMYDPLIPDIIYNGNIYAEELRYPVVNGQLRLLGSKYLIMREEYWNRKQYEDIQKEGVLITTGGTDDYEITVKIMDAIKNLDIKTRIVIGPGYKEDYIRKIEGIKTENVKLIYKPNNLKEYISSSKIVITAGGSTVYEVLSQKSIPVVFSIADNQDLICKKLKEMGTEYLGKYPNIDYPILAKVIRKLWNNRIDINDKIFNLVSGNSSLLLAKILVSKIN